MSLRAPFPYFGGKALAAPLIWEALGEVDNFIEPFAGSLAVLLARPHAPRVETVNDVNHYVANFWRALQRAPEEVAAHAEYPALEVDLHARHDWLVHSAEAKAFRTAMEGSPEYFDAKVAGWWVWGASLWIGSGWCAHPEWKGRGHVAASPRGVHGLGAREGEGCTWRQVIELSSSRGATGRGVNASGKRGQVHEWLEALAKRLRYVRVSCGDFLRILTPSATTAIGLTGVLLDPPYKQYEDLYAHEEKGVAERACEWAVANGDNPQLRIALCGYEGDYQLPEGWRCVAWKAAGGYSAARGTGENAERERIWLSPHCLKPGRLKQADLFGGAA
ncbi:MAG TPA: DNA adenine methylase [Hyalangium sp.]|nr:DNA adenine methylase [Hyalangium sp.]